MRMDVVQLGVYVFGGSVLALSVISAVSVILARSQRATTWTFSVWRLLWRLAAIYAVLAILAVGIPTTISPLTATAETVLSIACLAATIPVWGVLHRWRLRHRTQCEATRATIDEATATAEHAAQVRRVGRFRIG